MAGISCNNIVRNPFDLMTLTAETHKLKSQVGAATGGNYAGLNLALVDIERLWMKRVAVTTITVGLYSKMPMFSPDVYNKPQDRRHVERQGLAGIQKAIKTNSSNSVQPPQVGTKWSMLSYGLYPAWVNVRWPTPNLTIPTIQKNKVSTARGGDPFASKYLKRQKATVIFETRGSIETCSKQRKLSK